ncbi:hypothetical protein NGR_c15540 [Sinorhizobium fredii NGR234]|uniref:Uncharacterized protein n=1 Tax=Sinorhizobium fredii (strain NBRC 101917 / NGR234) TaxID=394 RepID=C3MD03_SINFN|nr:hypothetical protein [Sinorhizobium fredii]ACP25322.1 hypothetical protein NGR_c15540 [Sinorhizobium fredii NGR234]
MLKDTKAGTFKQWTGISESRNVIAAKRIRIGESMRLKYLIAAALAAVALSGCASTGGAGNTTYAQWYGPNPVPDFSAATPGGVRMAY